MEYFSEFLTVAVIHFLAVASPGPDFAVTMRQSISHGRRAGVMTSLGIGAGIFVHVAYCIVGLGVLISQSIILFNTVKYIGALYLIYIGFRALRTRAASEYPPSDSKNPFGNTGESSKIPFTVRLRK